jgi:hypothetical protein
MENSKKSKLNNGIVLQAEASLNEQLKEHIKNLNNQKPNFPDYCEKVRQVFGLDEVIPDQTLKLILGGFIIGEGSFSVSIKKNKGTLTGIEVDPVFNITQHINGVNYLYLALKTFKTGRIRYKADSKATLVFVVEPRKSIKEKVCPYLEKYVYPFSSRAKQIRFNNFQKLLDLFDQNAHLDKNRMINEILPIWDEMRMQKGYSGESFKTLEEAQEFVRNFEKK